MFIEYLNLGDYLISYFFALYLLLLIIPNKLIKKILLFARHYYYQVSSELINPSKSYSLVFYWIMRYIYFFGKNYFCKSNLKKHESRLITSMLIFVIFMLCITLFDTEYFLYLFTSIIIGIAFLIVLFPNFIRLWSVLFSIRNNYLLLKFFITMILLYLNAEAIQYDASNIDYELSPINRVTILSSYFIILNLFYTTLRLIRKKKYSLGNTFKLYAMIVIMFLMCFTEILSVTYDAFPTPGFTYNMSFFNLFYYVSGIFFGYGDVTPTNDWTRFVTIVIAFSSFLCTAIMLAYVLDANKKN